MSIILVVLAVLFAFGTVGTKKDEERRIYSHCFIALIVGIVVLELIPKLI